MPMDQTHDAEMSLDAQVRSPIASQNRYEDDNGANQRRFSNLLQNSAKEPSVQSNFLYPSSKVSNLRGDFHRHTMVNKPALTSESYSAKYESKQGSVCSSLNQHLIVIGGSPASKDSMPPSNSLL